MRELAKALSDFRKDHPEDLSNVATELKALELLHKIRGSKAKIKGESVGKTRLESLLSGEIELE